MSWKHFMTRLNGQRAQVLLDKQFEDKAAPSAQLPHLATITVHNQMDPSGALWHPDEAPRLEKLEESLMGELEKNSYGWAVYLRRVAYEGFRQYFVYFGDNAKVGKAVVGFQDLNPNYKVDVEFSEDPTWAEYAQWLKDAPLV